MPRPARNWRSTKIREESIKIAAKIVCYTHAVTLKLAVMVRSCAFLAAILGCFGPKVDVGTPGGTSSLPTAPIAPFFLAKGGASRV
jgi:hypothetical protein